MVLSMQYGASMQRVDVFLAVVELVWYSFLITRKLMTVHIPWIAGKGLRRKGATKAAQK
jgi:hypothetical protein